MVDQRAHQHRRSLWLSMAFEFPQRMRSNAVYSNRPFLRRPAMWAMPLVDTSQQLCGSISPQKGCTCPSHKWRCHTKHSHTNTRTRTGPQSICGRHCRIYGYLYIFYLLMNVRCTIYPVFFFCRFQPEQFISCWRVHLISLNNIFQPYLVRRMMILWLNWGSKNIISFHSCEE